MHRFSGISRAMRGGLALLALALFFTGCDFQAAEDAFNEFDVTIALDPIETSVSGQFIDAATGELLTQRVDVEFSGPGASAVVDIYSDPIVEQEGVKGGVTSFGISNDVSPTAENPLELVVTVNANGYESTSKRILVRETGDGNTFAVRLVNPNNPPEGTSARRNTQGQASSSGQVTQPINVTTPTEQQSGGSATADIDAGATVVDRNGNPLDGQLTTNLVYYNNKSRKSLEALPDGFRGAVSGGAFVGAAAASVSVTDASGRKGSRISASGKAGEFVVTVVIPAGTINPLTGQPVVAGDVVTLLQFTQATGQWTPQGTYSITENDNGDLVVVVDNLDGLGSYLAGFVVPEANTCTVNGSLTVQRNGRSNAVSISGVADGILIEGTFPSGSGDVVFNFSDVIDEVPEGTTADFLVTAGAATVEISGIDPCSANASAQLPAPAAQTVDAVMYLLPNCPVGETANVTEIPTASVFYRQVGSTVWEAAGEPEWILDDPDAPTFLVRGEIEIDGVEPGAQYEFKATADGDTFERTVTVPANGETANGRVIIEVLNDPNEIDPNCG